MIVDRGKMKKVCKEDLVKRLYGLEPHKKNKIENIIWGQKNSYVTAWNEKYLRRRLRQLVRDAVFAAETANEWDSFEEFCEEFEKSYGIPYPYDYCNLAK